MKSDRRGLYVRMGYVTPIVADSGLSTAGLISVLVIVSMNAFEVRLSSSPVEWKFKSPARMTNDDELDIPPP